MKRIGLAISFALLALIVSAQTEIKMISYNIRLDLKSDGKNWWEKRKDKVARLMNYYEPDFGNADTWNAFKFNEKPNGCIEYIFVSSNKYFHVSKFATLTDSYDMKYPSDHFPILATIFFDK